MPHLYGSAVVEAYRRVAKGQASPEREQLPPHVYATACAAYRGMMRDKAGQAILVRHARRKAQSYLPPAHDTGPIDSSLTCSEGAHGW